MPERDPDKLADELEREADHMEEQTEKLGQEVSDTREDWERKRSAADVPGAPPKEEEGEETGDSSEGPSRS